ncbi:MAG: DUF2269 family protein [Chloroflexota bacterium]|nr:DUF2269 family protein [Chloroflexota bacterium]
MLEVLKVLHTLLAIAAVGTNISFPVWTRLAEREGSALAFTLSGVRFVDRWVTIPSYLFCALTGVALVVGARIPFSLPWIWISLVLFAFLMVLGFGPYRPLSRERLALARTHAIDDDYRRVDRKIDLLDGGIIGAAVVITVLMVARPG